MTAQDQRQFALQIRIGLFVFASLVVLLALIYLLGAQARLFEARYDLIAEYREVGGLLPGSTVRLAGVQIGRVKTVALPEDPGGKVRVTLNIARRFAERIRADSVARIETQGLLGDKLVEISLGSPDAPLLKPGMSIATREPIELSQLAGEGVDILKNVAALSANVNATVESLNRSGAIDALSATLKSAQQAADRIGRVSDQVARVTEQVEKGKGWLHVLLYEEPEALRRLQVLLASTERLLARAEHGEHAMSVLLSAESGRAARRLLDAMDSLSRMAEKAKESDSLLAALLFDPRYKSVAEDVQAVARNFREVSERLTRGKGVVADLLRDEGEGPLARATQDFRVAAANLRTVTDRLVEGRGLLGSVLEDEADGSLKRAAEDFGVAAGNLRAITDRLAEGKGVLGGLLKEEEDASLSEATRDFKIAMANLRALTDRLAAGEGTLGGLLEDPTVYENLAAFLEGAQRSTLLRYLIRSTMEKAKK
jgi:phospholipid/cholesterol/gamma-HCH transport system substrate-binding protein